MNHKNIKKSFETLAVAVLCLVAVMSINQTCSGTIERFNKKTEVKKAQELKNDTIINNYKLEQKVR